MYISEHDKTTIRQAIEKQLRAFQEDDAVTAFACVSPTVQQKFDTPDKFITMVKQEYQAVYCPRSFMFRGFTLINDYPAQVSIVMDRVGNLAQTIHIMQHQSDRTWRIHGYYIVPIDEKVI